MSSTELKNNAPRPQPTHLTNLVGRARRLAARAFSGDARTVDIVDVLEDVTLDIQALEARVRELETTR